MLHATGEGQMALTKLQRRLRSEAEEIAGMAQVDFWNLEKKDNPEYRTVGFKIAIAHLVTAEVITRYTLLDEILSDYLCRYYFKKAGSGRFIYWKRKKFRLFVHYLLDEMFLLKKMQMAHAIKPLPKEVRETIQKLNAIRNAVAHSFFPENRKEHYKTKKVLYAGKDIRTSEGLRKFKDDCHDAYDYIQKSVLRVWRR
jgi:hypothetical protein